MSFNVAATDLHYPKLPVRDSLPAVVKSVSNPS